MGGEERWMSVEDIAKHLGVRSTTVYRWIEGRGLPAHRVGKLWMLKKSEVDQWVRANRYAADPATGTTVFGASFAFGSPRTLSRDPIDDQPMFCREQMPDEVSACAPPSRSSLRDHLADEPGPRREESLRVVPSRPEVGRVVGLAAVAGRGFAVGISAVAARGRGKVVPMGGAALFLAESVRAAAAYLRCAHEALGLSREWLAGFDVGVLCDSADLPDQGLALSAPVAAAIVSTLGGRAVLPGQAAFGGIGEDGGLVRANRAAERLRAARAAGIRKVLLPAANAVEIERGATRQSVIDIAPVGTMAELLGLALSERPDAGFDLV